MTDLLLQLPDDVAGEIQQHAKSRGITVSRFVEELVRREAGKGWPKWFFEEVVGGWQGEPLERPAQLPLETRKEL
jgi:hypothetical protein